MENLNAEVVKKALKLCANEWYCGLCEFTEKECALIKKNALALINSQEQRIKELTEERNEVSEKGAEILTRLEEAFLKLECENLKLTEENANLHASCTEFERKCASLNDEVERLRDSSIDYRNIPDIIAEAKADTVKEFAERLKAETITIQDHTGKLGSVVLVGTIDQIAKEMLEGE